MELVGDHMGDMTRDIGQNIEIKNRFHDFHIVSVEHLQFWQECDVGVEQGILHEFLEERLGNQFKELAVFREKVFEVGNRRDLYMGRGMLLLHEMVYVVTVYHGGKGGDDGPLRQLDLCLMLFHRLLDELMNTHGKPPFFK